MLGGTLPVRKLAGSISPCCSSSASIFLSSFSARDRFGEGGAVARAAAAVAAAAGAVAGAAGAVAGAAGAGSVEGVVVVEVAADEAGPSAGVVGAVEVLMEVNQFAMVGEARDVDGVRHVI